VFEIISFNYGGYGFYTVRVLHGFFCHLLSPVDQFVESQTSVNDEVWNPRASSSVARRRTGHTRRAAFEESEILCNTTATRYQGIM